LSWTCSLFIRVPKIRHVHMCFAKLFWCMLAVIQFKSAPWEHNSCYLLPSPLLELWVLVRRQKTLAFITSSPILDHGIRIHVSPPYRPEKFAKLIWRITGILLLNFFVALLYAIYNPPRVVFYLWRHVDWSPRQRLDTTVCFYEYKFHEFLIFV
jgi:hypothetical protein